MAIDYQKLGERSRAYTETKIKYKEKFPVEWLVRNAYEKGYSDCHGEMNTEISILTDILKNGMTLEFIERLKQIYVREIEYSKKLSAVERQITNLEKSKAAYARRIGKGKSHRNRLMEMNKAELAHKINNDGQGQPTSTTKD